MPDQTGTVRGVGLLIGEGPTGLTAVHARIDGALVLRVREHVAKLRTAAAGLPAGQRVRVVVAYGRPGRDPRVDVVDVPVAQVDGLRDLVLGDDE